MLIPAMDAVNSGRFGFIDTDSYTILARLYDGGVENKNHGETYQRAEPIWYRVSEPTAFESALQPTQDECREISDEFYEVLDLLHEMITPSRGDTEEIYFDATEWVSIEYEQMCAQQIFNIVLGNEEFSPVIRSLAKEGFHHQHSEADISLSPVENSDRSFTESDFTDQQYIPKQGDKWDFVDYHFETEQGTGHSLWFRYEEAGHYREIPLVVDLDGLSVVADKDPDFGSETDDRLSQACLEGLESGTIPQDVSDSERELLEMVQSIDLPFETQLFVEDATSASPLK